MKKGLSVALVVAMVSSMFASVAMADDAAATAPLTAEQKYEALKLKGILEGGDNGADLNGKTTRAQIAKILTKAFGKSEDAAAASVYTDLDGSGWATGFIGAVTKAKLMDGVADGKFAPTSNITLEQLATVLVRAYNLDTTSTDVGNAKVSGWAKGYVAAAIKAGLISASTDFTADALRSDLVNSAYVAVQGPELIALTADKFEVVDSKNVKVTFSDKTVLTFPLATALEAGKETAVTVDYKGKMFTGKVTLPVVVAKVTGVTALTNSKIKLTLDVAATSFDKGAVSIQAWSDKSALEVKDAALAADGKSVVVTTAAQTAYAAYTVTVNGVSKNFVGLPTDTGKPSITNAGVTVDGKGTLTLYFNEDVDAASATNVANYTFDNNLTAASVAYDSATRKVTVNTSAQTAGQLYQLTVQNVADNAGNVMDKKSGLYFSGVVDTGKPSATTVTVKNDGTLEVQFNEAVKKDLATAVQNYTIDNNLTVTGASLNETTNVVTLTTSAQTVGQLYKLTVKNVADVSGNVMDSKDLYFSGVVDTVKPTATVSIGQDSLVKVTFNEAVNKDTAGNVANYTLDNNLTVTAVKVADDAMSATLTTSTQTAGQLYKLTIKNVADKSGNVIDTKDYYFSGVVDTAAPTLSGASTTTGTNNQVVLTFSEALNKDLAQDPTNYVIDGGLNYPTKAVYAETTVNNVTTYSVTLTTADQKAGQVYNVTVNNLKDIVGNQIAANSKKGFSGVNSNTATVTLQTITAVDQNTLDLYFDSEPSGTVTLTVYAGSTASGTPLYAGSPTAVKRDDKKILRAYFGSALFPNTNGQVYTVVISGLNNLPTDVAKNTKTFGGSTLTKAAPQVQTATAINSTAVKVIFSNTVSGVTYDAFNIVDTTNNANTPVNITSIQDGPTVNNTTSVILNLNTNTALQGGHAYKMTFNGAAVQDPAGAAWKIVNSDNTAYAVTFGGLDIANAAPKMVAATAKDKYNYEIIFSEAVDNAGTANYALFDVTANAAVVTSAVYTPSSDKTKLVVSLDKNGTGLIAGHAYRVTYTGSIVDKQGIAYDTATDANKVQLGGTDAANDQPVIVAVDANSATDQIKLTFNEDLYTAFGSAKFAAANGALSTGYFTVTIGGNNVTVNSVDIIDAKTVRLNTANFTDAKTGTVTITTAGSTGIVDINGQASKTDAVSFGTR